MIHGINQTAWRWILLASLASGCDGSPQSTPSSSLDTVQIALNWIPDAQHGGFYAADTLKFFEQESLQAKLIPGGPGAPVVQSVALRRVEFAVGNSDQILMARAQGAPIVAVFAAMQNSPRCIMVHRETGITSLAELQDLTLALGAGKAFAKYLQRKLPLTRCKIVPYTGSVAPFLQDSRFAQQAYVFSEPFVVRQRGADPVTLLVSDLGFNPYTSCLFTHADLIRENPERVRRVVRAVQQGWLEYFRNPDPIHQRILEVNPQMDAASLEFGRRALQPLCLPPKITDEPIGWMSAERWQTMNDQLVELDLLPPASDPGEAFTTRFLRD